MVLSRGFENELDAARAYDEVAAEYQAEYAYLNFDHFMELEDWWRTHRE